MWLVYIYYLLPLVYAICARNDNSSSKDESFVDSSGRFAAKIFSAVYSLLAGMAECLNSIGDGKNISSAKLNALPPIIHQYNHHLPSIFSNVSIEINSNADSATPFQFERDNVQNFSASTDIQVAKPHQQSEEMNNTTVSYEHEGSASKVASGVGISGKLTRIPSTVSHKTIPHATAMKAFVVLQSSESGTEHVPDTMESSTDNIRCNKKIDTTNASCINVVDDDSSKFAHTFPVTHSVIVSNTSATGSHISEVPFITPSLPKIKRTFRERSSQGLLVESSRLLCNFLRGKLDQNGICILSKNSIDDISFGGVFPNLDPENLRIIEFSVNSRKLAFNRPNEVE